MFELLNELRDVDPEKWNDLAERTIKAIRKLNPERKIIVGGIFWNISPYLKYLRVFDDENVIYTFHMYAPNHFTHQQGVLQATQIYYNRKMQYPSDDVERYNDFVRLTNDGDMIYRDRVDIEVLRDAMQGAIDFVKAHPDKILWCGEFGTIRHADITSRENWMRDVIKILKENDIPYSVWNYLSTPNDGNRFSLVDDDSRKILSERMLGIIQGEV